MPCMGVLQYICCIFSEQLFLKTFLEGYLWFKQELLGHISDHSPIFFPTKCQIDLDDDKKEKHIFKWVFSDIAKEKFMQKLHEVNWDHIKTFGNTNKAYIRSLESFFYYKLWITKGILKFSKRNKNCTIIFCKIYRYWAKKVL